MKQILIVEDDELLNKMLVYNLQSESYGIVSVETVKEAMEVLKSQQFDLVLLDINLPDGNGYAIAKTIREKYSDTIVIFLTANDRESDEIRGYELGAVDYITKPFSVEELLARIRVTQRRLAVIQTGEIQKTAVFINGELKIDYTAGCTYMRGEELHLTPIEYKLLCLLSRNVGKVLTHTYITQQIWGRSSENDVASLRVFMATLRKKLESDKNEIQYIQTHIGIGYRMLRIE